MQKVHSIRENDKLHGINRDYSKTVRSNPANPQKSAKVFGSCLVPRLFPALELNDLSNVLWSPPSGFDMVDLSRIFEKHEGFHASP